MQQEQARQHQMYQPQQMQPQMQTRYTRPGYYQRQPVANAYPTGYEQPIKQEYHRGVSKSSTASKLSTNAVCSSSKVSTSVSSSSKVSTNYDSSSGPYDSDAESGLISNELLEDPVPYLAPKSKKMALGSITFTAEQGKELGVPVKDNSFYLRVEKCDPVFCEKLNFAIEDMVGYRFPNVHDPSEYWPQGALLAYSRNPNPELQRDMNRVYRYWHDQRCGMDQLVGRLNYVKQKIMQGGR